MLSCELFQRGLSCLIRSVWFRRLPAVIKLIDRCCVKTVLFQFFYLPSVLGTFLALVLPPYTCSFFLFQTDDTWPYVMGDEAKQGGDIVRSKGIMRGLGVVYS